MGCNYSDLLCPVHKGSSEGEEAELVQAVHKPYRWWDRGWGGSEICFTSWSFSGFDGRCFLRFGLSVYNSTICQVLVEKERERQREKDTHTQKKWLLKATEGSNEIGAA